MTEVEMWWVRTSVTNSPNRPGANFLFLSHFDVIWNLFPNRCTATWNLLILWNWSVGNTFWNIASEIKLHVCYQSSPFGAKVCSHICSWTISVPRGKQFSESVAWGKLQALSNKECLRTNNQAYFCPKWRLLSLLSSKYFHNMCSFEKWGILLWYPSFTFLSFSWQIFGHMMSLDQSHQQKFLMDYKQYYSQ